MLALARCALFFAPFGDWGSRFTPHIKRYEGLSQLNGDQHLKSGSWKDLEINGNAELGSHKMRTIFEGIAVVNGNLKAKNCRFDLLDARGNFELENNDMKKAIFFGAGSLKDCKIETITCKGPGKIKLTRCDVAQEIFYSSLGYPHGRLIIEDSHLQGKIIVTKGDVDKIESKDPLIKEKIEEREAF